MGTTSSYTNSGAPQTDDELLGVRGGSTVNLWGASYVPATASDAGTDAFEFNAGRDVADKEVVPVSIGSASTTTTPTLENTGGTPGALTVTTKDGSALWSGALNGDHHFKRNGATSWLVLDPNPLDGDQPASVSYVDTKTANTARIATGTYTGDGTTSKGITGLGFQPSFVKIWELPGAQGAISISEATQDVIDDGGHVSHDDSADGHRLLTPSGIVSLDAGGFTVSDRGSDTAPNTNGTSYGYMAIG